MHAIIGLEELPTPEFLDSRMKNTRTYDKENFLTFWNRGIGLRLS